jgi:hypothetical protein
MLGKDCDHDQGSFDDLLLAALQLRLMLVLLLGFSFRMPAQGLDTKHVTNVSHKSTAFKRP